MQIDEELPPVTNREASEEFQILQRRYSSNPAMLELLDKMDNLVAKERLKNFKQKIISYYFVANL